MKKVRKGFTLVELLIVIGIIGMLSAMMMVSNSEAQNAARATKISEGFRSLTAAAMMFYNEDPTSADKLTTKEVDRVVAGIKKYIKNDAVLGSKAAEANTYYVAIQDGTWWLTYTLAAKSGAINDLLVKKAGELGLTKEVKAKPKEAAAYDGSATMYVNVR